MRCKNCKEKFEPIRFLQKYCFNPECVKVWVDKEKQKQWKAKKTQLKKELMSLQDYLKIAQQVFNKYIRERDKGMRCISCGKEMKQGNIDAGHLWSAGGHSNIRFNEYNVNAQCSRPCNKDKSGDTNNYRIQFIKRYSQEILDQLDLEAHVVKKWNIEELMDLIAIYKQKFQELSKK
jgi:hypothetical protein